MSIDVSVPFDIICLFATVLDISYSMCVSKLLGGVWTHVPELAPATVHQKSSGIWTHVPELVRAMVHQKSSGI